MRLKSVKERGKDGKGKEMRLQGGDKGNEQAAKGDDGDDGGDDEIDEKGERMEKKGE